MAQQPRLDVVDMHHARVTGWLRDHPGKHPRDLLSQFVELGANAFFFKASEGRIFDPRFRDLVATAHDLGITRIGAYHVNLRGDAGLARVDEEFDNFMARVDGLPVDVLMVDWEIWQKKLPNGTFVARTADDPLTGGTIEQTVRLIRQLEAARPGKVFLYGGLPMIPRHVNDVRLRSFPLVYPDYRTSSRDDPVAAAARDGIAEAASRIVMHQWGGENGVLGFDSNRIVDRARFDEAFGSDRTDDDDDPTGEESDVAHIPMSRSQRAYDTRATRTRQDAIDGVYREANKNLPRTQLTPENSPRKVFIGLEKAAFVVLTAVGSETGFVKIAGVDDEPNTSILNLEPDGVTNCGAPVAIPSGHIFLWSSAPCDIVVDVFDRWN